MDEAEKGYFGMCFQSMADWFCCLCACSEAVPHYIEVGRWGACDKEVAAFMASRKEKETGVRSQHPLQQQPSKAQLSSSRPHFQKVLPPPSMPQTDDQALAYGPWGTFDIFGDDKSSTYELVLFQENVCWSNWFVSPTK